MYAADIVAAMVMAVTAKMLKLCDFTNGAKYSAKPCTRYMGNVSDEMNFITLYIALT